jgi:sugar lactone lactonase YvrE
MNTYADFLRGRMSGLALSRDGKLSLAPKLDTILTSDQPEVWTLARAANGTVYAGTGHRGRVYQIDGQGRATVVWTSDQPEIFALATDGKGALYAGASPDGKVYRIENGKAVEFFDPKARYIWALAFGPDGALYVGTGDQGRIFRVEPNGSGSVYYESGQAHITALGFDREGRLLAGSEPNGILYRVSARGKAFVLYDANLPEIRGITTMPDGAVYIAALGGSVSKRAAAASSSTTGGSTPLVTAPAMSITVTDSANAQAEFKQPKPEAPKPQAAQPPQTAVSSTITTSGAATVEIAGVDKSAIYRINPDNTVEQVWSSKEENAYDLAAFGSEIMFVTDVQGRLYRLNADRRPTLVAQTGEGEATRVVDTGGGLMIATGNLGKVYRLVAERNGQGWFESPVHDANTVARWGRLSWRGVAPPGTRVVFRTRAGNSARPDNTWSDWSPPVSDPNAAIIQSPNARYLQWRLELTAANGQSPVIDSVTAAYLPQNTPPSVRSITVSLQPAAGKSAATSTAAAAASAYSITVTDTGDTSASTSAGTPLQTVSRGPTSQIQLIWQADDPDGDKLTYSLYFRGDDEAEWKLIRGNLAENTFLLDTDVLADGRYLFRVVASDRASNPPGSAREAELASSPILIDNTPPAISVVSSQRSGQGIGIEIQARDATSPLRRCEYSLDAGPWAPLEAADGVTDSPAERFALNLDKVAVGEHVVVFRVFDAANNAGLAKVVVR